MLEKDNIGVFLCCAPALSPIVSPVVWGGPLLSVHVQKPILGFAGHRTCVAVAGNDYCIVAASTRLSTGFSILSRDVSMILKMCDSVLLSMMHQASQAHHVNCRDSSV